MAEQRGDSQMTQLLFLGSGGAFALPQNGNYQSNLVLTAPSGKKMLIDCGTQCTQALHDQHLTVGDIDAIYCSHNHPDHSGGLAEVAYRARFLHDTTPELFGDHNVIADLHESLYTQLTHVKGCRLDGLRDWFRIRSVTCQTFWWEDIYFRLIEVPHIDSGDGVGMPSFGLYFETENSRIYFTSDSQFLPTQEVLDLYQRATIIFQECETGVKSGVHTNITELMSLPDAIKKKMWLYHYADGPKPIPAGFAGYVQKGEVFHL